MRPNVHKFRPRAARGCSRRGFTLLETALATMIVGIAFVAVLQLLASGTVANVEASELTTGTNLARNIRELTLQSAYSSLPTFNNVTYSPPRDSRGVGLTNVAEWSQKVVVQPVDPHNVTLNVVDENPDAVRITVTVSRNNEKVCDMSWYCFDATP